MNVKRGAGKDSHRILEQPMETSYRTLSEKGSLENAWRQRLNGAWSARSEGQACARSPMANESVRPDWIQPDKVKLTSKVDLDAIEHNEYLRSKPARWHHNLP
ncbi:uncharacterized protein LOC122289568 isoform X3 [Carya illinoinensis]|uniref:uncharacterized protein LOC122289568 isoform X3 n=1 Tax=Carya illinoinensis TaxID=32201 RepID=UPI001C720D4C|nr:uncharacterized protein LOC122289568 isoform X3 [Carya illinoinensis]